MWRLIGKSSIEEYRQLGASDECDAREKSGNGALDWVGDGSVDERCGLKDDRLISLNMIQVHDSKRWSCGEEQEAKVVFSKDTDEIWLIRYFCRGICRRQCAMNADVFMFDRLVFLSFEVIFSGVVLIRSIDPIETVDLWSIVYSHAHVLALLADFFDGEQRALSTANIRVEAYAL